MTADSFGTVRPDPRRRSFAQMPEELLLADISPRAKVLWGVLDRQAKGREVAIDSRPKLAAKMHCGETSIDDALRELVAAGWVGVTPVPGRANRYTLYDEPTFTDPTLPPERDTPNGGVPAGREGVSRQSGTDTRAVPSLRHEEKEISLSARTPARDPVPPVAGERETLIDLREQPQPPAPGTALEPVTVLEGEIVDPPDPLTRAFLPALRVVAPDITEPEAGQLLAAVTRAGIDSLAGWVHSPAGRLDIPARLTKMRTAAVTWADVCLDVATRPEPCTDCRGGYLGMDEDFRPKPCPRCRPHLVRTTA